MFLQSLVMLAQRAREFPQGLTRARHLGVPPQRAHAVRGFDLPSAYSQTAC